MLRLSEEEIGVIDGVETAGGAGQGRHSMKSAASKETSPSTGTGGPEGSERATSSASLGGKAAAAEQQGGGFLNRWLLGVCQCKPANADD